MRSTPAALAQAPATDGVRVVGIGASAGGLAALEAFFRAVPLRSGLAYLVVQHMDPTQKALLANLLQRVTPMPVLEAQNHVRVAPDCVYVIPPNSELSLVDGTLKLEAPVEVRGMRLPVNVLFTSLARAQRERAIAVILSGMGSDGTLGMLAVKALGGLTVVQEPASAQFDAMPRSALDAGCGDIVAPPPELPARILAYAAVVPHAPIAVAHGAPDDAPDAVSLRSILVLLRQRSKHDFSFYKAGTLHRRIQRRMAIHSLTTLAAYAVFLEQNGVELDLLFKELLIGVTSFFRDPAVWRQLVDVTLPELLARRGGEAKLRAWVVGCSTGEEAYSLAMAFSEASQKQRQGQPQTARQVAPQVPPQVPPQVSPYSLQIFASDLSEDAIATARRGVYPAAIATDVSAERLAAHFIALDGQYRVKDSIRDMVLFAAHDALRDPPFTRLDVLSCRNLMIYFDATLQTRLLPLFHYSLRPGGILLLGSSETVGRFNRLFIPLESKLRLYQRQDNVGNGGPDLLGRSFPPLTDNKKEPRLTAPTNPSQSTDNLQSSADKVLLQVFAPPAVVVNDTGDILYISGRTGRYLEPAAGKANWNFHAMVRDGLRAPLAGALLQAAVQSEPLQFRGLQVQTPEGTTTVDVTVQALREPAALRGLLMVVFHAVAAAPAGRSRRKAQSAAESAHAAELQQYSHEIQALREEARATKEELQSANEELQSTNEELQSANEELTTSKEELQSMNEELQTVNAEMQTRLDDLALAQGDMKNLLNSTDIAILFLDKDLNVRRYTDRASKIINLRESDIGRPLSDLTTSLQYPSLYEDVSETVRTLVFSEKQILTSDGRWFSVRVMPYRRLDNVIDGAVITLVDITATKRLESTLRAGPPG